MPASQRLHHGEQGNQIYLGDREALPSLTLHYVQRAAVQGASLLPSIIFGGSPAPHMVLVWLQSHGLLFVGQVDRERRLKPENRDILSGFSESRCVLARLATAKVHAAREGWIKKLPRHRWIWNEEVCLLPGAFSGWQSHFPQKMPDYCYRKD